jgi:xanthine dehydrogenase iron-sulfur cluster and FAD-binding subunit A
MTENHHHDQYMTNTHILVEDFDYIEVGSVEEAISLMNQYGKDARLIAGGTNIIISMKMEHVAPKVLINIGKIPGLNRIEKKETGELVIGALATIRNIRHDSLVQSCYPTLAQACASFGSAQIEVMATIGGNLCNGSPASDTVPALMALDAIVVIQGPDGVREVPVEKFSLGPGRVDLKPQELVVKIVLPPANPDTVGAFVKIARVTADLAKASLAMVLVRDGDRVTDCRIACGAVAPTPIRIRRAESLLIGKYLNDSLVQQAGLIVSEDILPIDDVRSNAWYRREVMKAITIDTLNMLWLKSEQVKCEESVQSIQYEMIEDLPKVVHNKLVGREECREIEFTLNGTKQRVSVKPKDLLLNILREKLLYTGTKYGCGVGECSACTVLVNDKPVYACLILASAIEGQDVKTVEGLQRKDGELDPLQKAFIEYASYQCGFCTPGFLMTLKGFLMENPHPDENEIRDNIKGNRCRCTGYFSIIRAVQAVVEGKYESVDLNQQ